jgi:hypothetical protein
MQIKAIAILAAFTVVGIHASLEAQEGKKLKGIPLIFVAGDGKEAKVSFTSADGKQVAYEFAGANLINERRNVSVKLSGKERFIKWPPGSDHKPIVYVELGKDEKRIVAMRIKDDDFDFEVVEGTVRLKLRKE